MRFVACLDGGEAYQFEARTGLSLSTGDTLQVRSAGDSRANNWLWVEVTGIRGDKVYLVTYKKATGRNYPG
jgi:hypothetical protein